MHRFKEEREKALKSLIKKLENSSKEQMSKLGLKTDGKTLSEVLKCINNIQ